MFVLRTPILSKNGFVICRNHQQIQDSNNVNGPQPTSMSASLSKTA